MSNNTLVSSNAPPAAAQHHVGNSMIRIIKQSDSIEHMRAIESLVYFNESPRETGPYIIDDDGIQLTPEQIAEIDDKAVAAALRSFSDDSPTTSSCCHQQQLVDDNRFHTSVDDVVTHVLTQTYNIIQPTDRDVLCGRGWRADQHTGNIRFRECSNKLSQSYRGATGNDEKKQFCRNLINAVRNWGGRFLYQDTNGQWNVASNDRIVRKVSQRFRDAERT